MYICICKAVTERQVREAIAGGCTTVGHLRAELGLGACCGKCAPEAKAMVSQCGAACGRRAEASAPDDKAVLPEPMMAGALAAGAPAAR